VVLSVNHRGRLLIKPILKWVLIGVIVHVGVEEGRQCGKCHRRRLIIDFDHNARGQLQRICRSCLVSLPLIGSQLYNQIKRGLTEELYRLLYGLQEVVL